MWIEYGKTFEEFEKEGLFRSWTEVECVSISIKPDRFLIGDVSSFGAIWGPLAYNKNEIVIRYRQIQVPPD